MFKKGLTVAALAGLVLAGCDADAEENGGGASGDNDEMVITFWHSMGGAAQEGVENLVEDFNSTVGEEEGIEVEIVYQGDYEDIGTNLRAAVQANDLDNLPDIMQVAQADATFLKDLDEVTIMQELVDNDEDFNIEDLEPNAVNAWSYEDELLGLPFASSTPLLYYNADMLREAGYDSAPTTVEELGEIAATLAEENEGVSGYTGNFGQYQLSTWTGQMGSYVVNERNGRSGVSTGLEMTQDGSLETFLTELKNAYDMGGMETGFEGDIREEFAAERVGMYFASTSQLSANIDAVGDNFDLQVAYIPPATEDYDFGAAVGGNALFATDRYEDQDRVDAIWEFLKFASSPESQLEWHQTTGYFPVNRLTHDLPEMEAHIEENPLFEIAIEQLHLSDPEIMEPFSGVVREINTILEEEILAFLLEEQTMEEAMENMDEQAESVFEDYNRANP